MKNKLPFMALTGLFLMCNAVSCKKDDNKGTDNNNPSTVSLPVDCDFSASKPKAAIQNLNGIDFTYTVSLPGGIWRNDDKTWVECIPAGTDSFALGGVWEGAVLHGAVIGDVSKLPAINKVVVKVHNNLENIATQLRVCDENGVVAETEQYNQYGDITLTADVGGKKVSKLYIYSASTVLYSVHIE